MTRSGKKGRRMENRTTLALLKALGFESLEPFKSSEKHTTKSVWVDFVGGH
ncbi:hypothetical protein CK203_041706 [Vitis vinifera]|uniref:Uncharacterized protein n=1 Tax=Vitis vinifera TaxID=29760 RepID=A0A438HCP1_VITVI|nr:hypothetical protein CK203_041706 [Vitis vinifera]